jgi:hypothetical protein
MGMFPHNGPFSYELHFFLSVGVTPQILISNLRLRLPALPSVKGQINAQKACNGFLSAIAPSGLVSCWGFICRFARYLWG